MSDTNGSIETPVVLCDDPHMSDVLARSGWLANCQPAFRDFAVSNLRHFEVDPGQTVGMTGDTEGGFYALVEGQAAFVIATGGTDVIGYQAYPGSWWGQAPMIGVPRIGYAVARTRSRLAVLPLPQLRQRIAEVPADWHALALAYSDLCQMAMGAHADMLIPGHLRRVAAALLRLGGNRHRRFPVEVPDAFFCTQEELASAVGLSRNATGRLLRRLAEDGMVEARYGQITLADPRRLTKLAVAD